MAAPTRSPAATERHTDLIAPEAGEDTSPVPNTPSLNEPADVPPRLRERTAMIMMRTLDEVGKPLDHEIVAFQELEDEVLQTLDHVRIAQVCQRAYGILMPVNDKHREIYDLPKEAAGVLWWSDGDFDDASSGLNILTADEVEKVTTVSTQAAIDAIVDHYNANPGDDQHPAYQLYRLETGADRDEEDPPNANAD